MANCREEDLVQRPRVLLRLVQVFPSLIVTVVNYFNRKFPKRKERERKRRRKLNTICIQRIFKR